MSKSTATTPTNQLLSAIKSIGGNIGVDVYNYNSADSSKMVIVCDFNDYGGTGLADKMIATPAYTNHRVFHFNVWDNLRDILEPKFKFELSVLEPFLTKNQIDINRLIEEDADRLHEVKVEFLKYLIICNHLKGLYAIPMIISSAAIISFPTETSKLRLDNLDITWGCEVNIFDLAPTVVVYNGFDSIVTNMLQDTAEETVGTQYLNDMIEGYRRFHGWRTAFHKIANVMMLPCETIVGSSAKSKKTDQ